MGAGVIGEHALRAAERAVITANADDVLASLVDAGIIVDAANAAADTAADAVAAAGFPPRDSARYGFLLGLELGVRAARIAG